MKNTLFLLLILVYSFSTRAQVLIEPDSTSESDITLDEVVISANKWSQSKFNISNKVSKISAKEVSLQNPQTAADLLGASGEVFIQKSQQGGGSPMIRGFSTNRLLYIVDGVRMNTAIFRSGNLQNVISLDPFATESTEILFGPNSVIYGSDAIGGVMNFQTLTPKLSTCDKANVTGKALTRYSSANNENTAHFDVNVGWKKWASLTSFTSSDFGDLRMGSKGPDEYLRPFYVQRQDSVDVIVTNSDPRVQRPTGYSQINMMEKLRFRPNDKWDFQYGFHYSETSEYSRYDRHIRYKNGLPRYGEWNYGPQKWMMNNLSISHKGQNLLYDEMSIHLAQQFFEESRISRDINKSNRETRIEKVDAYSINVDFKKSISEKNTMYYGIEAVQNDVNSIGIDENIETGEKTDGPARYPQSTWASYAAYLSNHHSFSEKVILQTGLRYNRYKLDATFDTTFYHFPYTTANMNSGALTGSIGVVYHPTEKWTMRANVSTGFRSPNVDDMGKVFDSEPGSVIVPNPDLEAEYAYNAEIDIAKLVGKYLKLDLSAYYTILDNALVRRDFTLNGEDSIMYDGTLSQVQAIQNAAVATVYGIQAGINIKLPSGFGFSSDFNYQKGEEEMDDGTTSPSRHAPPCYGVSRLTYQTKKLNIQFYAVYSDKKEFEELPFEEQGKTEIYAIDENGNPYSPSWYTLNFKAMYQLNEAFTISAGLENITDQRYRPYSSGIVAAGRNFILSLKAQF
ncbi:MAG TPA: TonB-dependent receptor [Bacteroidales bacterium]|nr:MAG: TonB-dependent receptor [Bacteroidetes bacterium GWF2_33_38]HBF87871.1 TonB-dependent receptor [Bacteroidales bacterium]